MVTELFLIRRNRRWPVATLTFADAEAVVGAELLVSSSEPPVWTTAEGGVAVERYMVEPVAAVRDAA